ncbi:hypothetical protein [Streptomyces canus]|uniref:hypothetical protein n=1 Tax=Streptomyces canus TaxID=58343 RepID=UPI000AC8768F|nr:hypothetical protein [Streptomyces canus]
MPNTSDTWRPFAENPAYIAVARRALEAAAARADAIHAPQTPSGPTGARRGTPSHGSFPG